MQSFFQENHRFTHDYKIRAWHQTSVNGKEQLVTYDGLKLRLFDFSSNQLIKETEFIDHSGNSQILSIHISDSLNGVYFLIVKDQKSLIAFDRLLNPVNDLKIEFKFIILSTLFIPQKKELIATGNFGYMQKLELQIAEFSIGTKLKWNNVWMKHDTSQWMSNITYDEIDDSFFTSSGVEVFKWSNENGNLLFKFDTKHSMAITSLCYSPQTITLYSASSDGTIKLWKVAEKQNLTENDKKNRFQSNETLNHYKIIKQPKSGKILLQIDDDSLYSISSERILRRYNCRNGNLLAMLDLQPTISLDMKNVEVTLKMEFNSEKQTIFLSEDKLITLFEVHSAPKEIQSLCQPITHIFVQNIVNHENKESRENEENRTIYALSKDNIVHLYSCNQDDISHMSTIDLDSGFIPSNVISFYVDGEFLICGLENGSIRIVNTVNNEINELDTKSEVLSIFTTDTLLVERHSYCSCDKDNSRKRLIFSSSANGEIFVHCLLCTKFITKLNFSKSKITKIQPIKIASNRSNSENSQSNHNNHQNHNNGKSIYNKNDNMIVGLCKRKLYFWVSENSEVYEKSSIILPMSSSTFEVLDNDTVAVASKNGTILIYDINTMTEKHHIRVHNSIISNLCFHDPSRLCSFAKDSSFFMTDTIDGIVYRQQALPSFNETQCATILNEKKLLIAIDKALFCIEMPKIRKMNESEPEKIDTQESQEDKEVKNAIKIDKTQFLELPEQEEKENTPEKEENDNKTIISDPILNKKESPKVTLKSESNNSRSNKKSVHFVKPDSDEDDKNGATEKLKSFSEIISTLNSNSQSSDYSDEQHSSPHELVAPPPRVYQNPEPKEKVDIIIIDGKPKLLFGDTQIKSANKIITRPKSSFQAERVSHQRQQKQLQTKQMQQIHQQIHQGTEKNGEFNDFYDVSFFYPQARQQSAPRSPTKRKRESRKLKEHEILQEEFFGSLFSVDVQPIVKPQRSAKTPIIGRRKLNFQEIQPIPKINTQRINKNNCPDQKLPSVRIIQSPPQSSKPSSKQNRKIDPLTITQIETISPKSKKNNKPLVSTRKVIHQPKKETSISVQLSNDSNYLQIDRKQTPPPPTTTPATETKNDQNSEEVNHTIEKFNTTLERDEIDNKDHPPKFDKKSFLKKLDSLGQDPKVKSNIAFTNGRVLPALHFRKEPDRYVIACAIHTEFSFNFFTFNTNPLMEKYLQIDEESYDLFDSNFETSNRLFSASRSIQLLKEIYSIGTNPLKNFLMNTPNMSRIDIDENYLKEQTKFSKSKEIQKMYENGYSTDSAFPFQNEKIEIFPSITKVNEYENQKGNEKLNESEGNDFPIISMSFTKYEHLSNLFQNNNFDDWE
ncbi:hypothetical protein TRFO_39375 [Tritrichomonas foetus]|uniref:Uncharacterized protein n=1 Tax=Tritrichomonas foetus TaxID=1144522 RepID=A0A1J4J584_9EUKA|nr:hypothetical protein TRFO_39375 [Tritrichomonas foetus]|eukprot:OHS94426.1 hypothetical protein TRFO_39375 [Tritrichomonas foetus]